MANINYGNTRVNDLEPFDIAKAPINASITGYIAEINLEFVDGIYKDKHKDGYWIKFLEPNLYLDPPRYETIKLYFTGLTFDQRSVISAASRLNQLLRSIEIKNKGKAHD